MKTVKYILLAIVAVSVFSACDKYEFLNLERDNPLDGKNNANMQNGVAMKYDSYYIYSDNNGDKIVNKGETVKLNIGLKNTGQAMPRSKGYFLQQVNTFRGSRPLRKLIRYYFGWLNWLERLFAILDLPFNLRFKFFSYKHEHALISITDGNGNSWKESFNVIVESTGASVTYGNYYVYSDNNGDKTVNKGETVKLNVSLQNTGSSTVKGVKATFYTSSEYVSGFTPTSQISYGNISAGSTVWKGYSQYSDYAIQLTVSSSTPINTQIPISISIVDESNNTWSSSFSLTVQ